MRQKRFANILITIGFVILAGIAGYFIGKQKLFYEPILLPSSIPTTTPAPNPVPVVISECKKDSDCPSSQYICEAIQSVGTACPSDDPSCVPTSMIIKGICKLKEGNRCRVDSDCVAGFLCHTNVCANPIGRQCNGPSDISCPTDYKCVQKCGPPVPRGNDSHPGYSCQLKGYQRACPICLASNTAISTPHEEINVRAIKAGMKVWSVGENREKVESTVIKIAKTLAPSTHNVMHLVFSDGRELWVSPDHSTADGKLVSDLKVGGFYDGAEITVAELVSYWDNATYDILPDTASGLYWANGVLLKSTLGGKIY